MQKFGIEGFKNNRSLKSKESSIWIIGTVLTALFVFIQWIPLTLFHTPLSLIAPLEGLGLIASSFFSYFILKEKFSKLDYLGLSLIISGTIINNINEHTSHKLVISDLNINFFWAIFVSFVIIATISIPLLVRFSCKAAGQIMALIAGACMAFQTLTKRITDIDELSIIFTFVTFFFSLSTFGLMQFAFSKADANVIVPTFASASIVLTSIFGVLIVHEPLALLQYIGIPMIVVGIFIISYHKSYPKKIEMVGLEQESIPLQSNLVN